MRCYGNSNVIDSVRVLVLLLGFLGLIVGGQARAAGAPSSQGGGFRYVRIFSAAVDDGLDKSLVELEAIAREHGTEEVAMFLPSDGPEVQADRWILREGSEEYAYPGVTVKARTHLGRLKRAGTLKMSKDGRKATGVLAREKARVEWALPETVRSPLVCDIYEDSELLAANTIRERLSPSGKQRWPEVVRIDVPGRNCSIIQVFEYLKKRPEELSSIGDRFDFGRKGPPDDLSAGKNVPRPDRSGKEKSPASDSEEVEKRGAVLFSASWTGLPSMDFDTGWKPGKSPLQARFKAGAGADISTSVWGEFVLSYTDPSGDANLTLPDNNSGGGNLSMDFGVEMSTRGRVNVDLKVKDIDYKFDIPYAPNFDLRCQDSTSFDSYLLSGSTPSYVEVRDGIDTQELYSASLAGIKGIVDVSIGVYADMEAWVEMSAYNLSTDANGEYREFTAEGQTLGVTPGGQGTYDANVDYDEDLDVGITVTFYPALCAEIDTYIYSWDYCVSAFELPVNIDLGSIDLDVSSTLEFEETYDLMIIEGVGGTTNPGGGITSSNEPWTETVEVNEIEPNYDFDHWFDHWVDACGVGGSNTIAEMNCTVAMDGNTPWHTLYPAFFYATAATPFPGDGTDKIGNEAILRWRAGEHADLHHMYFGTSFSDVDTRAEDVNRGVRDSAKYDTNAYDANLGRCKTYYWRVDELNDGYSGAGSPPSWESNVVWRFISVGCRASEPMPADGHDDVPTSGLLRWVPGACVNDVNGHDVYFGTDYYAVENATTSSAEYMDRYDSCRFDTNDYDGDGLEIDRTYYWRVDEMNNSYAYVGPPDRPHWKGDVWSFTVGHIPVDNFEDYYNTAELQGVWQDSNGTGADNYLEPDTNYVQEGIQSMRYEYNNVAGVWYSMVVADTYDLRCGSDWTAQGVKALVVYFYGDGDNDPCEQMWVGLQDGSYKSGFVECEADANDANEWNVDLNDFNNVDLTDVNKVFFWFGDRDITPVEGWTGTVWFDEIRLYPPRCRPEHSRPEGDIAGGDCMVNLMDFSIMGRDWLMRDWEVTAEEPNSDNLLVEYLFDPCVAHDDLYDSSGEGRHGEEVNAPDVHDGILTLNGTNFVNIPFDAQPNNPFDGSEDFTIAMEFRTTSAGVLLSSGDPCEPNDAGNHSMAVFVTDWGSDEGAVLYGNFWLGTISEANNPVNDDWHHVVITYDSNSGLHRVHLDGIVGAEGSWNPNIPDIANDVVRIGGSLNAQFPEAASTAGDFVGDINSVEIYDYALSEEEVCYLANEAKGYPSPDVKPCYQPLRSPANLVRDANDCENPDIFDPNSFDPNCPDVVNLRDLDKIVEDWLVEVLWPEP